MFRKILIANRGEIACRIIDTAHSMGIQCVAVYSEADARARHVSMADEAYLLGPAASKDSYLRIDKIIDAAIRSGAQAIHPGYGFLSENPEFAKACHDNNLVFIGPPVSAIEAMGSKSAAKTIMGKAGVPLVPGYHGDDQSDNRLQEESARIGYPQLLKAAYGGGGKGMRVVWHASEFDDALAGARREASASFGNDKILLERYLTKPRHIEIQVFADNHGNAVYLAERDCSVQRRHQKVIEEAPAPGFTAAQRQAMGEAAVKAARAIDYRGAGTVEFLFDEDGTFYFMEMNTRLQVEHPVTEMITGQDLVKWQLEVAAGQPMPLTQADIPLHGHALEVRIYAEDPEQDFLPATGTLHYLRQPAASRHVRIDTGVTEHDDISPFYDPMIAKLIVWDENRNKAINRMLQALTDYRIAGVKTNLNFLYRLVSHPAFQAAELDTHFIQHHQQTLFAADASNTPSALTQALALAALYLAEKASARALTSPWQSTAGWQLNEAPALHISLLHNEQPCSVIIQQQDAHREISVNNQTFRATAVLEQDQLTATLNDQQFKVAVCHYQHGISHSISLFTGSQRYDFDYQPQISIDTEHTEQHGALTAPMNGTIVAVMVTAGQPVNAGDTLLVMEAMKMEYSIKAPAAGSIKEVYYSTGDLVQDGAELVEFIAEEA
ncbi:acetyl/propionyl/methylcrotonyl-CoA carboxylase subunit alpha [Chromatiaceae bacterium AAb-1]|nr:acetyl/propionyl/methylcrotonyl-CoA carboxylase subunit alpha [Chromatiaceae bacterium AAb-1]